MEENRNAGIRIKKLHHMMGRNLMAHLRAEDVDEVTIMHGWILKFLEDNKEKSIYQKDIEKGFSIGKSTVTNIIQLMEKKDLLKRETCPKDARLKRVLLTEKGMQTQQQIEGIIEAMDKETVEGIKEEDLEVFFSVLDQIQSNVERQLCCKCGKEEIHDKDTFRKCEGV